MKRRSNARSAALEALRDFRTGFVLREKDLNRRVVGLSEADRALAVHLTYGVIQNYYKLDACIKLASDVAWSKIQPQVRDILRLGIYQLHFLDRIPKSAAVDESVNLVRECGLPDRVKSFVNAVLRKASLWNEPPHFDELWIETSHPKWLVDTLTEQESSERAAELLRYNNQTPPIYLQLLKPEYKGNLIEAGAKEHPFFKNCYTVTGSVEKLPGFAEAAFVVADNAARMAVEAAAPEEGERVLDACAAPGGKSIMLSKALNGNISLTSCDISTTKIENLQETLAKYGVHGVQYSMDAAKFNETFEKAFDLVLADVPCSGMGVIRKKPDIRYKPIESVEALPVIQLEILENLSRYVTRGGRLVYVTCTVLRRENHDVVSAFLERHSEFSLEPFSISTGGVPDGEIQIWPPEHGTDGFYIAKLRRVR